MLEYGKFDHGRYKAGLGDWADKIKTGQIQPPSRRRRRGHPARPARDHREVGLPPRRIPLDRSA